MYVCLYIWRRISVDVSTAWFCVYVCCWYWLVTRWDAPRSVPKRNPLPRTSPLLLPIAKCSQFRFTGYRIDWVVQVEKIRDQVRKRNCAIRFGPISTVTERERERRESPLNYLIIEILFAFQWKMSSIYYEKKLNLIYYYYREVDSY